MGDHVTIYIDPVFPHETNEPADLIIITHDHPDHWNRATVESLLHDGTRVLGTPAIASQMHGVEQIRAGMTLTEHGIPLAIVPAYTTRRANPHALKQTGAMHANHPFGDAIGFILRIEDKNVYYTGDTDIVPEMNDIAADIVLLPVGGNTTMDAKAAARAVGILKPRIAIPLHYGTSVGTADDAELFKELVEREQDTVVLILTEGKEIEL